MRGVTSLIGGFSYLRIDFDCEYTYNNINNVVDIKIRKDKEEDVKKAQEVVSLMDEIISVCDNHRQKR